MKATINDVAKLAGVSIKTVSRVMNNEPSVRQITREKVQQAVDSLQYQPNLAARNLASTSSYNIAYVYDNPNAYYIINMQAGILSTCRQQGYELLIHPCDATQEHITDDIIKMVKQSRIAGLVLTPPFSEMPHFVESLVEQKINFVRIMSGDIAPDELSPCVMINDRYAAEIITQHLIDLGHKQIGFLAGGSAHKSTIERLKGYKKVLQDNQMLFNKDLVLDGEYSFESGVDGAKKLLTGKVKPTAIFSCNDEIAAGALFSARLLGIEIPEQLAIVGFENSPFSRQTRPKLTTADQPNVEIAENATSLLINKIRNKDSKAIISQFTPKLVIRESTEKTF